MEVDIQSLFGLHVTWCAQLHSCTHLLRPSNFVGDPLIDTLPNFNYLVGSSWFFYVEKSFICCIRKASVLLLTRTDRAERGLKQLFAWQVERPISLQLCMCSYLCAYRHKRTHLELGVVNHATIPPSPQTTEQGGDQGDGRLQMIYRDMATRQIFWGFCKNWFDIGLLHYISSRSNFGFEFAEIFVIEKRLSDSPSFLLNIQKPTLRLGESESRFSITNISATSKPKSERLER